MFKLTAAFIEVFLITTMNSNIKSRVSSDTWFLCPTIAHVTLNLLFVSPDLLCLNDLKQSKSFSSRVLLHQMDLHPACFYIVVLISSVWGIFQRKSFLILFSENYFFLLCLFCSFFSDCLNAASVSIAKVCFFFIYVLFFVGSAFVKFYTFSWVGKSIDWVFSKFEIENKCPRMLIEAGDILGVEVIWLLICMELFQGSNWIGWISDIRWHKQLSVKITLRKSKIPIILKSGVMLIDIISNEMASFQLLDCRILSLGIYSLSFKHRKLTFFLKDHRHFCLIAVTYMYEYGNH